tara:strand:+ start:1197 stop:2045 length:849 start_codon:yes stop_codon:yes gene_type:complete
MDFGQQRMQQQEAARQMMYQNQGYQFERRQMKSLIVDVVDTLAKYPLTDVSNFSVELFEPLIVDKLSDIYLDNFTTYNSLTCDKNERSMFSLQINEFNVNSNVASSDDTSSQNMFNRILIPNENDNVENLHSAVIHKGKKMNYVCSINPGKLTTISGKLSDLKGQSMFTTVPKAVDGRIRHIKMKSSTKFTENIKEGSSGEITNHGNGQFINAYYTDKGSRDLYFYPKTDYNDSDTMDNLDNDNFASAYGGISTPTPIFDPGTYRIGDYPRFVAEFVIVARD